MLSKKMEEALNKQMNAEFYNSHLYQGMAAWLEGQNLPGMAHWMQVQAGEEHGHAMRLYVHIKERRGTILLSEVAAPPAGYASPLNAFEEAFEHEVKVSGAFRKLMDAAIAEKDFATAMMLQWFVTEQVEEEAQTDAIVQQLRMAGESKGSLMQIDHHLSKRKGG